MKLLETKMEQFRMSFPYRHVTVYDDFMVYRTPRGLCDKMAKDANNLINKLNLDLVAIPTSMSTKDSFCVKSSETDAL